MSTWLFNIFIDRVVRKVKARVVVQMTSMHHGGEVKCEMIQLLFTDDITVVAATG